MFTDLHLPSKEHYASLSDRLAITSRRHNSLKSPKVLFTRTSVYNKDNFFPIPSLDSTADLTSELSTDNDESDIEPDGAACALLPVAVRSRVTRPRFHISDGEDIDTKDRNLMSDHCVETITALSVLNVNNQKVLNSQISAEKRDENRDLVVKLSSFVSDTVSSNGLASIECSQSSPHKTQVLDCSETNIQSELTRELKPLTLCDNNSAVTDGAHLTDYSSFGDNSSVTNETSEKHVPRKSRLKERVAITDGSADYESDSITDTPLNKKVCLSSPDHRNMINVDCQ